MRKEPPTQDNDAILGAAALSEVTSMTRVGGLEVGKAYTSAKVRSLKLDAIRARRRGKAERADELETRAADQETLFARISAEQELEQMRAPVATKDENVVTGRVTDAGRPKHCLRADLTDANGESLAHAVTDELGGYTIRTPASGPTAERLVVSDGDGKVLRSDPVPELCPGTPLYVDTEIAGEKPCKPTEPPEPDTSDRLAEVPNTVGMVADEATAKVKEAGLTSEIDYAEVANVEPGTVVRQSPSGGARVERGTEVQLWVAAPREKEVPDLKGRKLRTALDKLDDDDLKLGAVELVRDKEDAGRVIDQTPSKGTALRAGDAVNLRIATGKDSTDLKVATMLAAADSRGVELGLSEDRIKSALEKAEIKEVSDMDKLSALSAEDVCKTFDVSGNNRAARVRSLMTDIARRFPTD